MTADGPDDGTFSNLARKARRRLPRLFADYIDGGAHGEHTLHRNRAAFTRWSVTPRGLRDVSSIDLTTTCFGRTWRLPFFLAPVGFAGMFHAQDEAATAHMAARHSIGMGISTFSIAAMEDLVASEADLMAQIYVMRDRAVTRDLLERAKNCGTSGIIVTIDTAITPVRERDVRNGFLHLSRPTLPQMASLLTRPRWLAGAVRQGGNRVGNIDRYTTSRGIMAQARDLTAQIDPTLDWDDLAWLRDAWNGLLVIKGIMHPADALRAMTLGADGIIVSNHGGRQMDPAPGTLDVLPAITEAVGGRIDIVIDGGIRRGGDVVTALALSAKAVSFGRPWAWGLAAHGERGVNAVLELLEREVRDVMALAGLCDTETVRKAGRAALWPLA
ncbi:alpha-hydroxy-acid oxidizing protein [Acetobacter senegalensis]|uniref:alpha-hydroxy acid oxidase n=1 Tax=Acetobacter senegalensis TaxID=446692 RepID=UPI001EDBD015|nr:alpha-hydroxy acid oxidase [Acetobacter senegalensis]MCG4255117.1 alpha-hydroxy-acid oxidizing protein [Acetobacter senegalensis]